MQGYRPTAVTQYAVRLMRAQSEAKPLPAAEPLQDPDEIKNAADYAGSYKAEDGSELSSSQSRTSRRATTAVDHAGNRPAQKDGEDSFISTVPGVFADHDIVFKRDEVPANSNEKNPAPPGKVIQVSYDRSGMQARIIPARALFPSRTTTRHTSGAIAASRFGAGTFASLCCRGD